MPDTRRKAPSQRKGHHPNKPLVELVRPGARTVQTWILPLPPDSVSDRAGGDDVWEFVWRAGGHAYVPEIDRHAIEMYVQMYLDLQDIRVELQKSGAMVAGSNGQPVRNPLFSEVRHMNKELRAMSDKLGLNPEARLRLGIGVRELRTGLDEFLES